MTAAGESQLRRASIIVFFAIAILFTWQGVRPHHVLAPVDHAGVYKAFHDSQRTEAPIANLVVGDASVQFIPWDAETLRLLRAGKLPWRNQWQGRDSHLFANIVTAYFSPFTWPRLLLGLDGWAVSAFLKIIVAAFGAAALARALGGSEFEALVAGCIYAGAGFNVVWAIHPHTSVSVVFPWFAAAVIHLIRTGAARAVVAIGLLAAVMSASGHPQTLMQCVVGFGAFVAAYAASRRSSDSLRRIAVAAVASLGGLLLAGIQIVPTLFLIARSHRAAGESGAGSVLQIPALVAQFVPGFLGGPLAYETDFSMLLRNGSNFAERSGGYVGLITILALVSSWRSLRRPLRTGLVVGVVALFLSWRTPGLYHVWREVPLLSLAAVGRFSVVFALFGAIAAGAAIKSMVNDPPRQVVLYASFILSVPFILVAVFMIIPALHPAVVSLANAGLELLDGWKELPRPLAIYTSRVERAIDQFSFTIFRRIALPIVITGVAALLLARRRITEPGLAVLAVGELLLFGFDYLPAVDVRTGPGVPRVIQEVHRLDPERRWFIAATATVYQPNLATLHQVRDARSYDALQSAEEVRSLMRAGYRPRTFAFPADLTADELDHLGNLGVRFVLADRPVRGCARIGGAAPPAVGIYEVPGAVMPPPPRNIPPDGLALGSAVSVAGALLLVGAFIWCSRPQSTAPPVTLSED